MSNRPVNAVYRSNFVRLPLNHLIRLTVLEIQFVDKRLLTLKRSANSWLDLI